MTSFTCLKCCTRCCFCPLFWPDPGLLAWTPSSPDISSAMAGQDACGGLMMQSHQFAILLPLAVGAAAIECTIVIHALAVTTTVNLFRYEKRHGHLGHTLKNLAILSLVISVAFVAHLAEIGLWAVLLVLCGEFQDLGTAYYHSAVNYATLS